MSEHKIQGSDMLLFIDPTGGTNYDTVVCLTSLSQTDSVQPVDASSACGPDKSPGAVDLSISFEGQHLQDPSSGTISGTNLLQLLRAEQTIGWKLSPIAPQAGDEIQEGTGYLSELSSTYNYAEIGVFSGTIQPYGLPTVTVYDGALYVGKPYGGGYIAYLDISGEHGLIVNGSTPLSDNIWSNELVNISTGYNYGDGYTNTQNIISGTTGSAALIANSYNGGGYSDWFLPNNTELQLCNSYINFPLYQMWTSLNIDANNAFSWDNDYSSTSLKSDTKSVFAARYF